MFSEERHREHGTTTQQWCCEWQQLFALAGAASSCFVLSQTNNVQAERAMLHFVHASPKAQWLLSEKRWHAGQKVRHVSCGCRYDGTGQLYYNLEYTVRSPQFFRHNISVYAARYVHAHFTQIPYGHGANRDAEGLSWCDIHHICQEYGMSGLFVL